MVEKNLENNHSQIFQISLLHLFQEYDDKKLWKSSSAAGRTHQW